MREKWGTFIALVSLLGVPIVFLIVAIVKDNWLYFAFSLPGAIVAGVLGLAVASRPESGFVSGRK